MIRRVLASMTSDLEPRRLLRDVFDAAVAAAQPDLVTLPYLPKHEGRVLVLGAGKAAAAMAAAAETRYEPGQIEGLVITRYGHGVPCKAVEVVEAGHPLPDIAGVDAARRMLALAQTARPGDLVVFLLSGGASALLSLPGGDLTLGDKRDVSSALLASGAPISAINCVRKHLSAVKGGRLAAAAAGARQVTLVISDVPGDDPAMVGSGPSLGDSSTLDDARAVLTRYEIGVSPSIEAHLLDDFNETPKPEDALFARSEVHLIATPLNALEAAAKLARRRGLEPVIVSDRIEGEARDVGRQMGAMSLSVMTGSLPMLLLSGGETTVTIRGSGRGGPNTEYLASMAVALQGAGHIHALACDTDGVDGSEDNAGAFIGPDTLARAADVGISLQASLANNDAYSAFAKLGDLVVTGPTYTNVNDFRAILIFPTR